MKKRILAALTGAALVAGAFAATGPAKAQDAEPVEVPAEPNIVDPQGDANGHSSLSGQGGGAYVGAADYLAVWFTNDTTNLYVHIQTSSATFSAGSIWYSIFVDPGVGSDCMEFRGFTPHQAVTQNGQLRLTGDCGDAVEPVEFVTVEGPEAGGAASAVHTLTVPRSLSEHLVDGATLAAPSALSRYYAGTDASGGVGLGILDDTDVGTDFSISAEEVKKKKKKTPVKKRTRKNKKPKPKPKTKKCAPFEPGEQRAEAETVMITDTATEEKPMEVPVTLDASVADLTFGETDPAAAYFNVQVDSKAKEAGLHVLFEFPARNDYDLNLWYPDGSYGARSHAWNTIIEANESPVSSTGHGGESTASSEHLVGIKTPDCGGWTVEAQNWLGQGGEFTIKVWLGEIVNDPLAPGEETP